MDNGAGEGQQSFQPVDMQARKVRNRIGVIVVTLVLLCCVAIVVFKVRQPRLVEVIVGKPGKPIADGIEHGFSQREPWINGVDRIEIYERYGTEEREYRTYYKGKLEQVIFPKRK